MRFLKNNALKIGIFAFSFLTFLFLSAFYFFNYSSAQRNISSLIRKEKSLAKELAKIKNEDQFQKNKKLEEEIGNIQKTYKRAVSVYEKILKLKENTNKIGKVKESFATVLDLLSQRGYASASATLDEIDKEIQKLSVMATIVVAPNAQQINEAPSSGYRRQNVKTDFGTFTVDVIAADLNSTRVIVDTASNSDCSNDCPVLSLGEYAARSGAFAAVNGPYFCPATYPSCADKKNSFDTLLMNKNKVYFNSANNVYSTVPAVIFSGNSARYVGQSLQWGRDTGVDAVIANQPLLVSGGQVVFGGDDEAKRSSLGSRSFIGTTGSTVYIGVVFNANVAQVARILQTMGIQNALNLDSGGSTALWSRGSYIAGPGRNLPFGVLLVGR